MAEPASVGMLVLIVGILVAATGAFIWIAATLRNLHAQVNATASHKKGAKKDGQPDNGTDYNDMAEAEVEHIFSDSFREELRNRGRLHFEKVIGDNAMFLQQDLRLTTSELNGYMKSEITTKLKDEFAKYEESIMDAKQLAVDAIAQTKDAIETQRQALSQQLQADVEAEKQRQIAAFQNNMADVINHYVLAAIGDQIDLNDQLEYILANFEANKKAIIEDLQNGS